MDIAADDDDPESSIHIVFSCFLENFQIAILTPYVDFEGVQWLAATTLIMQKSRTRCKEELGCYAEYQIQAWEFLDLALFFDLGFHSCFSFVGTSSGRGV